jgi:anti-anti-sigma factor
VNSKISSYDIEALGRADRQLELSVSPLEHDAVGPCSVVSLAGKANIGDYAWVELLLGLQAAHGCRRLVVDLSRLSSMDWWVALLLLWASQVVSRRGATLILASPQPAVARMLNAAGQPGARVMHETAGDTDAKAPVSVSVPGR